MKFVIFFGAFAPLRLCVSLFALFLFSYVLLSFHPQAEAGVITLSTRMTLSVEREQVRVLLEAENKGDEAAERVKAVLYILGQTVSAESVERIDAGTKSSFTFELPIQKERTGRFSFIGEVFFHDRKMNPYSALTAGTFPAAGANKSGISVRTTSLTLDRKGKLKVAVSNRLQHPQPLKAALFLPYALTASKLQQEIQVEPGKESAIEFEIRNRCGLGGARYPIFCVFEYDENGAPNTVLAQSLVVIKEPENWFVRTRWHWLWGLFGILGVWAAVGIAGRAGLTQSRKDRKDLII